MLTTLILGLGLGVIGAGAEHEVGLQVDDVVPLAGATGDLEREAFLNRHRNRSDPTPPLRKALEPRAVSDLVEAPPDHRSGTASEPHQNFAENTVAPSPELFDVLSRYLQINPHRAGEPPGWFAGTIWAYTLPPYKPALRDVARALELIRAGRTVAA